ncbi:MAG: hypothetical protein DHS20C11_04860 [Lysobacteraceae bacterium]|nr:MAG: hypothetical protein DHS20C11_04860 [Xanthomonadaceae bacterium]
MKNTAIKFGAIAGGLLVGFSLVSQAILGTDTSSFEVAEIAGYAGILLSMSVIYLVVKKYRHEVAGPVGFAQALLVGLVTDLIASILYGLFMLYYFMSLSPEFLKVYMDYYRGQIETSGASPEQIASELAALEANAGLFTNPYFQSMVMFLTVFAIGAVIALISAWILRSPSPVGSND